VTRPYLSALAIALLLTLTLWGLGSMIKNSVAVIERNRGASDGGADMGQLADRTPPRGGMTEMAGMGGRIAFTQSGRIAVAMGNGAMPAFLTGGPADHSPVWSPDGTKVAFMRAGAAEQSGTFVVNADATDEHRVAPAAMFYSRPSWSPDSRRLVFRDETRDRQGIYTVNADGAELRRIFEGNANTPTWSPDGRWIAFTFNGGPTEGGLYVMDPDGADLKVALPGVLSEVAWSPDSKLLAVRGVPWRDGTPAAVKGIQATEQVLVVERGTGKATLLTTEAGGGTWAPVWSPDGKAVAFVMGMEGMQQLMLAPVAGGSPRALAQGTGIVSPMWSPDGTALAVGIAAEQNADALIMLVYADGGQAQAYAPGEFPSWGR
jgi:Tol biopolymer transport system component